MQKGSSLCEDQWQDTVPLGMRLITSLKNAADLLGVISLPLLSLPWCFSFSCLLSGYKEPNKGKTLRPIHIFWDFWDSLFSFSGSCQCWCQSQRMGKLLDQISPCWEPFGSSGLSNWSQGCRVSNFLYSELISQISWDHSTYTSRIVINK